MKKLSFKDFIPLLLKVGVIVCCCIGLFSTAGTADFMSSAMFLFFTIQSNIWIAAICVVFLVYDILHLVGRSYTIPQWLYRVKFMFTVAITLTFLVFSLMLTPPIVASGNMSYLVSGSNICLHNLSPIFAILDWCLYDYRAQTTKKTFLLSAIMPLYYYIFAMIGSVTGLDFGGGAKVPYFFMDYEANGWFALGGGRFGCAYWFILLVGLVLGEGLFFVWIKNKSAARFETKD